jgi:radical SAM superfamily enzyme
VDPGYGKGFPVHEQIRRGINFSRRRGETSPRLMVSLKLPAGPCPPEDHLRATFAAAAQDAVSVLSVSAPPECVTESLCRILLEFSAPEREVWIEVDGVPPDWLVSRDHDLKLGIQVEPGEDVALDLVRKLRPDAVGLVAPAILSGTPAAERYERGEMEEPELEEFASTAARFLELIPASVAVQPVVLSQPSDHVAGPRWVLNRQKVQEAVGLALEERGTSQGDAYASALAEGQ